VTVTSGSPGTVAVNCGYTYAYGSPSGYTTAASLGTPTTLPWLDDVVYANKPIGFSFNFNDVAYTTIGISSNGFIWFGTGSPSATNYTPLSSTVGQTGTVDGIASVFGTDMTTYGSTALKYVTFGSAGSRVCVIEWLSAGVDKSGGPVQSDFQIRLNESNSAIEFWYRCSPYDLTYAGYCSVFSAQTGIRGSVTTDFQNRTNGCEGSWASTSAGTNTAGMSLAGGWNCNSSWPSSGKVFVYTPTTKPTITPNGQQNICQGGSGVTLTAVNSGGMSSPSYQWQTYTYPPGNTDIAAQTGSTYFTNPSSPGNYFYTVKLTSGSCVRNSDAAAVVVTALPSGGTLSGSTTACEGTTQTYTLSGVSNATAYTWNITGAASITGSGNTRDITFGTGAVNITVTPTNGTCNGSPFTKAVTVSATPTGGTLNGATTACSGATGQSYSLTGVSNVTSYNWSVNGGAAVTPSGNSALVDFSSNNVTVSVTPVNGTCAGNLFTQNVAVNTCGPNIWLGASTLWTDNTNWSYGAVPNNCATDVLIPSSPANGNNFPVISAASYNVGKLTVQDGASITVNNTQSLSVCGDFIGGASTGSSITGTGRVILNGTGNQSLSGKSTFQTLQVNKASGTAVVQNNSFFDVFKALELKSGALDNSANTSGLFTLKSNNTAHAIFNDFSATYTGTFAGTIYEERYYLATNANSYNQHFIGSPVGNADLSQFGAGGTSGTVTPTPNCSETQLDASSVYGSVFTYDQATGASCPMATWTVAASGNNAVPLKGYSVAKTGSGTLTVHGTPNTASSYSLNNLANSNWTKGTLQHPSSTAYGSGWQLVSNPYNATLDLTGAVVPGFDNQVQIWDALQAQYFPATVIAPFQAFFVHKTNPGAGGTYTVSGSKRVVTAQTFYAQNEPEQLRITGTNGANALFDVTTVGFNEMATDQFDPAMDINKLIGTVGRHNLYSLNNGYWMNKNILHSIAQTGTVEMGFEPGSNGSYTFAFDGLNSFDPTSYISLEDKKLNTFHNVRNGDYAFTSDIADDWNRFVLHFTPKAEISTADQQCNSLGAITIIQPGSANWTYTLTDNNHVSIGTGMLNNNNSATIAAAAGTYTLTLVDANNYTVVKTVTVNGTQPVSAAFTASSTLVEVTGDVIFTSTTANAVATTWDFGDGSISTTPTATHNYVVPGTYAVTLTVTNAVGCSSTATQSITVTEKATTGVNTLANSQGIAIWANENRVYVDFSKQPKVEATVEIFNVLGQQLVNEKFGRSTVYTKALNNMEAAYVIVRVKNDESITTKRVLILNK